MSTENNIGIQTRAMAQWVDNEANPEQLQRAANPAMNPTVELQGPRKKPLRNSYDNTAPLPSIGITRSLQH